MCLRESHGEGGGQKGMNQPLPWLFPDKAAQNTFCPGGGLGLVIYVAVDGGESAN